MDYCCDGKISGREIFRSGKMVTVMVSVFPYTEGFLYSLLGSRVKTSTLSFSGSTIQYSLTPNRS